MQSARIPWERALVVVVRAWTRQAFRQPCVRVLDQPREKTKDPDKGGDTRIWEVGGRGKTYDQPGWVLRTYGKVKKKRILAFQRDVGRYLSP